MKSFAQQFKSFIALSVLLFNIMGAALPNAVYAASATVYVNASWNGTTNGDDPDGDGPATSFGEDSFAAIQAAINAASNGDIISIAAGAYSETVTISKELTLTGAGKGASTDSNTVLDATSGATISISASNVTLNSLRVDKGNNVGSGISISGTTINNLTLDDITVMGAANPNTPLSSPGTGLRVSSATTIDGLTVTDSNFDGNDIGWYLAKESAASGSATVTDVSVTNSSFNDNTMKGIYAEKLDQAVFSHIQVEDSGTLSTYGFNAGIDINLKWSAYSDITIEHSTVSGSGLMGSATNVLNPAGITIKARDDAPSYASPAATLSNVTLSDVTVTGGVNSLRFGETAKSNAGPSNVTIVNSSLTGMSNKGLANESLALIDATNNWWGAAAGPTGLTSGSVDADPWYVNSERTISSDVAEIEDDNINVDEGELELPDDTAGEAQLPTNTDTLNFTNNSQLNLSQNTAAIGGGDPINTTTPNIGGQTVNLSKKVVLQSGTANPITISNTDTPSVTLTLPASVSIYAPTAWDGVIKPPTTTAVSGTAPSGFSFGDTVIKVGSDDSVLVFDSAVELLLTGVTGPVGYLAAGSTEWQVIEECAGTYASPTDPGFPGECSISDGIDTKILTYHFTTFAALNDETDTSTPDEEEPTDNQNQPTPLPNNNNTPVAVADTTDGNDTPRESEQPEQEPTTPVPTGTVAAATNQNDWLWVYWLLLVGGGLGTVYWVLTNKKWRS